MISRPCVKPSRRVVGTTEGRFQFELTLINRSSPILHVRSLKSSVNNIKGEVKSESVPSIDIEKDLVKILDKPSL